MDLAQLAVVITADLTKFDKQLSTARQTLEKTGKSMSQAGKSMTTALTLPLVGAGTAAVKLFSDFETGMANVGTLLGDAGPARVAELGDAVKNMAKSTGTDLNIITDGLYQVISAFGDTAEAPQQLEIAARMASAGMATTTDAVNLLAGVSKAYNDTSAEMQQRISDLAFETVNVGMTTIPELAASIGRVTPVAATLGVGIDELFGQFAALTGVTGGTAEVSTQLASILRAMMSPTDGMAEAMKKLGYTSAEAMVKERGMVGALRDLVATTDGTVEGVNALFGRAEALSAVFALTGESAGQFDAAMGKLEKSAGATGRAFELQQQTVAAQLARFKQDMAVVMVDIGQKLVPLVTDLLIPAFKSFGEAIAGVLKWYQELSPAGQTVITVLLGIAVAAGPVVTVVGNLIKLGGGLIETFQWIGKKAIPKLGEALFWLTTNPIGQIVLVVGALIALGVALYKNWDTIKAKALSVWEAIADGVKSFVNVIITAVNWMIRGLNQISFKVPDWVPLLGGKSFGFNIKEIPLYQTKAMSKAETNEARVNKEEGRYAGTFGGGGVVPGPIGQAVLATVHAGERILTPSQQKAEPVEVRDVTVNVYFQGVKDKQSADFAVDGIFRRLRALGVKGV